MNFQLEDKVYHLDNGKLRSGIVKKIIFDEKGTRIYLGSERGVFFNPEQLTKDKSVIESLLVGDYVNKILQLETVDFKEVARRIWDE